MSDKVNITPKVLKWARESARLIPEKATLKAGVSAAEVLAWEQGAEQLTIRQADALAKVYRRPLAAMFLPEVPNFKVPRT